MCMCTPGECVGDIVISELVERRRRRLEAAAREGGTPLAK
jgi:hypothetical protein